MMRTELLRKRQQMLKEQICSKLILELSRVNWELLKLESTSIE